MEQKRKFSNVLVTGGAGFIGSAFIRYLLTKDEFKGKVVNYDLLTYAGNLENLKSVSNDQRYFFVKGDICNKPFFEKICDEHKIDTIVHFAAETHVDNSISSPMVFLNTNVLGTFTILESLRQRPEIHLHHISTDEVYGSLGKDGFFTEKSKYDPSSPYSASKAASDHFVSAYSKTYSLSTTISHSTNNFGPHQHEEKLIPLMIFNLLRNKKLPIYGNGQNVRDWLYVEDHADALYHILKFGKSKEVYNVGGGEEKTNLEVIHILIDILARITKEPREKYLNLMSFVKDRSAHDFRYAVDCSKIKKELHWKPSHTFYEGLEKTIFWYLKKYGALEDVKKKEMSAFF